MRNSDVFLGVFSEIERWLRKQLRAERSVPFYQLVERASSRDPRVRHFRYDLKEFADLRNAIVHERSDSHVIAEPNEHAVETFSQIRDALIRPSKLIPQFQKPVATRRAQDPISRALQDMHHGDFSQMPVIGAEGNVVGLLTARTIVRWLAVVSANGTPSMDTPIVEVLSHTRNPEHYLFLARSAPLHEAIERFESAAERDRDLDAILITHGGDPAQKLLGILTVFDLPDILDAAALRR